MWKKELRAGGVDGDAIRRQSVTREARATCVMMMLLREERAKLQQMCHHMNMSS